MTFDLERKARTGQQVPDSTWLPRALPHRRPPAAPPGQVTCARMAVMSERAVAVTGRCRG
jgi:hypothetical protein